VSASSYQRLHLPDLHNVPWALRCGQVFVIWRIELRNSRATKVPYNPHTLKLAKSDDPRTWGTWGEAVACYETHPNRFHGIGRVFTADDHMVGIDLDDCIFGRNLNSVARTWLPLLNSYSEVSPSGRGVKVWVRANHDLGGQHGRTNRKVGIELHRDHRYFAITGRWISRYSGRVESRQEVIDELYGELFHGDEPVSTKMFTPVVTTLSDHQIIDKAHRAKNGWKFSALWCGDITGYPTQSEADLALMSMLLFWTRGDRETTRRLFTKSALGQRSKWKRLRYQERTLNIAARGGFYAR
jgi:primase-polymerase (primpol)-like protein